MDISGLQVSIMLLIAAEVVLSAQTNTNQQNKKHYKNVLTSVKKWVMNMLVFHMGIKTVTLVLSIFVKYMENKT